MRNYLFILMIFIIEGCSTTNNSPCVLQATYDAAPATSSFAFNQDGTFEWINGSALGGSSHEGRYTIKDSIIMLDKIGFDKVVKSNRLLITSRLPWSPDLNNRYVIQVDDQNNIVDSMFVFRIYLDKRSAR